MDFVGKLVTVLMPVYNGEKFIKEAIDSILSQTFKDFDFLIIDDASTDKTEEIIKSYKDPRIMYIKNETNLKVTATLNRGLSLITTKYIARMDADDISMPHRLATQVALMEKRQDVSLCGSGRITFKSVVGGTEEEVITICDEKQLLINSIFNTSISHPSIMMRTSVLQKYKISYNEDYIYAQDKAMWLQLSQYGTLHNIKEPLIKYRIHAQQVTNKYEHISRNNSIKITIKALSEYGVQVDDGEHLALMLLCYPQPCGTVKNLYKVEKLIRKLLKEFKNYPDLDYQYFRLFLINRLTRILVYSSPTGYPILFFILLNRRLTLLKFGRKFYINTLLKRPK